MRYELIRLMMSYREQGDLFRDKSAELAYDYLYSPREGWLRRIFSKPIYFTHRNAEFAYVPTGEELSGKISGKIGRRRVVRENEPPEAGLATTMRDVWKAADFVLDPTAHDDGQKVALADDQTVGNPLSLMKALANAINARIPPEEFVIEANGIADPETFFQFVKEHSGQITAVSFELVAPNMFGSRNALDEEMRQLRDEELVKKAKIVLQNQHGLNLDTQRVRETASYTAEGGGNIFARTRQGKRFSSRQKGKSVNVPQLSEQEGERVAWLQNIIAKAFRT